MTINAVDMTLEGRRVVKLPAAWSNNARTDYLDPAAYASFARLIGAAVAATGGAWGLNDALRPYSRQVELWNQNYEPRRPGTTYVRIKYWNGIAYGRRRGTVEVAVPNTSDHGKGIAVDITGDEIQRWLHANAAAYGWVFDVPGERWHMAYKLRDNFVSWPAIDWAWVQTVTGATVDGKPGPGTIAAVKDWQKTHHQTPDGIIGPATAAAMLAGATTPTPHIESEFLMALTADNQKTILNAAERVMGRDGQRFYKIQDGRKIQVAPGPGAIPSQSLDDLDGDYIIATLAALSAKIDALAAEVKR